MLATTMSHIGDMEKLIDSPFADSEEVIKKCEDVEKIAKEMTNKIEDMEQYKLEADQACSDADKAADNDDRP